jgi:hypothetical protein
MGIRDSLRCSFVDHVPTRTAKVMPFADAPLASAFVARWCVGAKVETAGGAVQVRRMSWRRGSGGTGRRKGGKLSVRPAKENPGEGITPGPRSRRSQMGECRIAIMSEHQAVTGSSRSYDPGAEGALSDRQRRQTVADAASDSTALSLPPIGRQLFAFDYQGEWLPRVSAYARVYSAPRRKIWVE